MNKLLIEWIVIGVFILVLYQLFENIEYYI